MNNNLILIGFMGCGKTSVGIQLAKKLSYTFLDTDEAIEKEQNTSIAKIFAENGEKYFRDIETNTIKKMISVVKHTVISTGGGLPLRDCNAKYLKELGYVVYLKATKETTVNRVSGDTNRPILAGDNLEEKVERLLKERAPFYEAVADIEIVTDNKSISDIISEILEKYESHKQKEICE